MGPSCRSLMTFVRYTSVCNVNVYNILTTQANNKRAQELLGVPRLDKGLGDQMFREGLIRPGTLIGCTRAIVGHGSTPTLKAALLFCRSVLGLGRVLLFHPTSMRTLHARGVHCSGT